MRFTVLWEPHAEQRLTSIWLDSRQRWLITQAAAAIDGLLSENPKEQGESRDDATRVLFVLPLGVLFEPLDRDRIVRVLDVWRIDQRW